MKQAPNKPSHSNDHKMNEQIKGDYNHDKGKQREENYDYSEWKTRG